MVLGVSLGTPCAIYTVVTPVTWSCYTALSHHVQNGDKTAEDYPTMYKTKTKSITLRCVVTFPFRDGISQRKNNSVKPPRGLRVFVEICNWLLSHNEPGENHTSTRCIPLYKACAGTVVWLPILSSFVFSFFLFFCAVGEHNEHEQIPRRAPGTTQVGGTATSRGSHAATSGFWVYQRNDEVLRFTTGQWRSHQRIRQAERQPVQGEGWLYHSLSRTRISTFFTLLVPALSRPFKLCYTLFNVDEPFLCIESHKVTTQAFYFPTFTLKLER